MFAKMKDTFKVPPSPFRLSKPSFQPAIAHPIKISSRRLSNSSHNESADSVNSMKQNRFPEVVGESEAEENSDYDDNIVKDSFIASNDRDNGVISNLFDRTQDIDRSSQGLTKKLITPPPTNKKRKRHSLDGHHKPEFTPKRRERPDASVNPVPLKTSLELTSPGSTSAHFASKQERKEARRKRKEERAKKREEKAKRKREKAKRSRESELRDSIDAPLPDSHDVSVISHPFQLKQETPSQNGEDIDSQSALEEEDDREVLTGKPSTKRNRGHDLEIPATQEHHSSSPTPQIASEHYSDKQAQNNISPSISKSKPKAEPVSLNSKPSPQQPNPRNRSSKKRKQISEEIIVDSSEDESQIQSESTASKKRKVSDLEPLRTPTIVRRVNRDSPEDSQKDVSEDETSEQENVGSSRRFVKQVPFSLREDERLHAIVKQYKKVHNCSHLTNL